MNNLNKSSCLQELATLRNWQKNNLSSIGSFAAYDLMLQLAIAFAKNEPITVKQIFISSHSYTAIRMYYKLFLKEDLIYLLSDPNDKRVKYIRPTIKFETFIDGYLGNIQFISPPENVSELTALTSPPICESFNPNRGALQRE
jgi:hypothetical protein